MSSQIVIPLLCGLVAAAWIVIAILSFRKNPGVMRLSIVGGVVAVAMTVFVIIVIAREMTINAAVGIPLIVATIVQFGLLIAFTSRMLSGRISQRTYLIGMLVLIAVILIGVVLMFQPVTPVIFQAGFDCVLIALLAVNVWSHINPRPAQK